MNRQASMLLYVMCDQWTTINIWATPNFTLDIKVKPNNNRSNNLCKEALNSLLFQNRHSHHWPKPKLIGHIIISTEREGKYRSKDTDWHGPTLCEGTLVPKQHDSVCNSNNHTSFFTSSEARWSKDPCTWKLGKWALKDEQPRFLLFPYIG